jgi:hypothetical protein
MRFQARLRENWAPHRHGNNIQCQPDDYLSVAFFQSRLPLSTKVRRSVAFYDQRLQNINRKFEVAENARMRDELSVIQFGLTVCSFDWLKLRWRNLGQFLWRAI